MRMWFTVLLILSYCTISASADTGDSGARISLPNRQLLFSSSGDLLSVSALNKDSNELFSLCGTRNTPLLSVIDTSARITTRGSLQYTHIQKETDSTVELDFIIASKENIPLFNKHYSIYRSNYLIDLYCKRITTTLRDSLLLLLPESQFTIQTFIAYSKNDLKQTEINKKQKTVLYRHRPDSGSISDKSWNGIRGRFRALLFTTDNMQNATYKSTDSSFTIFAATSNKDSLGVTLYTGPVIYKDLAAAGDECTHLLFPLWSWMRVLSLGLMHLFNFLLSIFDNVVLSIIALSVCVKIIIAPLFFIADKWQQQVNRENSILLPRLAEIKSRYKGEEQTQQILAAHKELGISPLYSLKSLLSAAIQIPVFFAAYHALSEHQSLYHVSTFLISDLSLPDQIIPLPFTLPFFGSHLNILPFVMTSITIASSWLHQDRSLSSVLQKKQRSNLYFMALLFFLLLYTSPSGMVLYWTMNNILAFISTLFTISTVKKVTENTAGKFQAG